MVESHTTQIRELLGNLQQYMDEQKWLEHDLESLRKTGKLKGTELEYLKQRQAKAREVVAELTPRILKPVIQMFPVEFREMVGEPGEPRAYTLRARKKRLPTAEEKAAAKARAAALLAMPEYVPPVVTTTAPYTPSTTIPETKTFIADMGPVVNALATLQTTWVDLGNMQLQVLSSMLPPLYETRDMLREQRILNTEDYKMTYPAGGGVATVTKGTLVLNLELGEVSLPNGTTSQLSGSLQQVGKSVARSVYIETNKPITVQFDDSGAIRTVDAHDLLMEAKTCRRVTIETESTTELRFMASTSPYISYQKLKPMNYPEGKQIMIYSDPDTQFTEAIATNAHEEEFISGLASNHITITKVMLISKQNLRYRLNFWRNSSYETTNVKTDAGAGSIELNLMRFGERIAGTGLYRHNIHDMNMSYDNSAGNYNLYLSLQNLSGTTKSAGGDGAVIVYVWYHPRAI